jgi:small subunit ribosomal protein S1
MFSELKLLPGSQIDVKPIRDYDDVNKTMEFKVVKINHEFKTLLYLTKRLLRIYRKRNHRSNKGQVLEGVVKNITSYGVFIDLGGVDGLIHITDLSSRINHPVKFLN